mmetsp:Transcript_73984/g.173688  ORF Transcript_73984/g.173688 Transcript_73984/m.173688 type:complete len:360 (-) Transcript_73984:725-1804(-)
MGALFDNLAPVHHGDDVGVADGAEAMGHDNAGAPDHQAVEGLLHELLALGVQRARRLVEEQDLGVLEQGAGDGDTLLLPSAKHDAALSALRVVALRQTLDEVVCVGQASGLLDAGVGADLGSIHDVVLNGHGKQYGFLLHQPNLVAQPLGVVLQDVHPVNEDGSTLHVIEPLDEIDKGRLAAPGLTDEGERLARGQIDAEAVHDLHLGARGIVEVNVLEHDVPVDAVGGDVATVIVDGRHAVEQLEDATGSADGLHELREDGDERRERKHRLKGEEHVRYKASDTHLVLEDELPTVPHRHQDARVSGQVGDRGESTGDPSATLDDQVRNVDLVGVVANLLLLHHVGADGADVAEGLVGL